MLSQSLQLQPNINNNIGPYRGYICQVGYCMMIFTLHGAMCSHLYSDWFVNLQLRPHKWTSGQAEEIGKSGTMLVFKLK